jgi:hypothetical protein
MEHVSSFFWIKSNLRLAAFCRLSKNPRTRAAKEAETVKPFCDATLLFQGISHWVVVVLAG